MRKRIMAFIGATVLTMSALAGCGNSGTTQTTAAQTTAAKTTVAATEAETTATEASWDWDSALEALLKQYPAEDNYLVLSGIVGGWAPTVMVLDKTGNFTCLVDYAGQAIVPFATGTYEVQADGSIEALGTQYDNGDELKYTIVKTDNQYSVVMPVPGAEVEGEITGEIKE